MEDIIIASWQIVPVLNPVAELKSILIKILGIKTNWC